MSNEYKKIVSEETTFKGKTFEIVKQKVEYSEKGEIGSFNQEIARRSPGIRAIIVNQEKKEILITKEYRTELSDWDYRLAGGRVFDKLDSYLDYLKSGKDIIIKVEDKVNDEVEEEAGVIVKSKKYYHKSIAGNSVIWDLYYYVIDSYEIAERKKEKGEIIEVEWKTFDEAKKMCLNGQVSEERSALVLLRFLESVK